MHPAVLERKFEELESARFQLQTKSVVQRASRAHEVKHMNPLTDGDDGDDDDEEGNTVVDQSSIVNLRSTWDRQIERLDADHSGTLDKAAIKQILASMGAAPHRLFCVLPAMLYGRTHGHSLATCGARLPGWKNPDAEIDRVWPQMDTDRSGSINFDEFAAWCLRSEQIFHTLKMIMDTRVTDGQTPDKNVVVELDELASVVTKARKLQDAIIVSKMREVTQSEHRIDHRVRSHPFQDCLHVLPA